MAEVVLRFEPAIEPDIRALRVYEAQSFVGPWTQIDRTTVVGTYPNYIDEYVTNLALRSDDWFYITWENISGAESDPSSPIRGGFSEIMASLNDVNAELDGQIIKANIENSMLIQINVARVIRGYLSRVVDNATLLSWQTPQTTPETIRVVAAKLIASQVYFNKAASQDLTIDERSFAQIKYDEAMALLQQIVTGAVILPDVPSDEQTLNRLDFFPIDSTDRAFSLSMRLD